MALAGRIHGLGYRVFCVAGDGELGEGQMWEAAMAAGHFELGSLVCIVDRNGLSIDGPTEDLMGIEPLADKFASFRWNVQRIDGHDLDAILDAYDRLEPPGRGRPQVIIADTVKGRGVRRMEGDIGWHVGRLAGADYDEVIAEIQAGLAADRGRPRCLTAPRRRGPRCLTAPRARPSIPARAAAGRARTGPERPVPRHRRSPGAQGSQVGQGHRADLGARVRGRR